MANITLDEKFLEHLTKSQKALIREYHRIMITSPLSLDDGTKALDMIDDESRKIDQILKRAEKDEKLCFYLELIDYFCTDVSEDEVLDCNKRAYLSEYLETLVADKRRDREPKEASVDASVSLVYVLIECADGARSFFEVNIDRKKLVESESLRDLPELNAMICLRCRKTLSAHAYKKVFIMALSLDASTGKPNGVIRLN